MRIVSGMRPTGRLHLGHYFGVLRNFLKLQEEGNRCFYFVADWHALTTSYKNSEELKKNTEHMMRMWLGVGLSPKKSTLFIQSLVKEHSELSLLLSMITPKSWLEWNPTYKDLKYNLLRISELSKELKERVGESLKNFLPSLNLKVHKPQKFQEFMLEKFTSSLIDALFEGLIEGETLRELNTSKKQYYEIDTFGFLGYPVLQTADIIVYKGEGVPVGEDQLPHIELSREIVRRFNRLYGKTFPEPRAILTESPKLLGFDGRKMSKSYKNAIYLDEEEESLRKKVMAFFTDPQKLRRGDPGRPNLCPVFSYHRLLTPKEKTLQIEEDCKKGILGCVDCKKIFLNSLKNFLEPIKERYERVSPSYAWEVFKEGSLKAREVAGKTLEEVREKMNLP